jgi:hypothetical protein
MATSYPAGYDAFTAISGAQQSDLVGGRNHQDMHNDVNDSVEAIEAELGLDPAGAEATVAARLTSNSGTIAGKANGTSLGLPGIAGNYASAPYVAAMDITGDIDLRAHVSFDDWVPAASYSVIASRYNHSSADAWYWSLRSTGLLQFAWSATGTAAGELNQHSTVSPSTLVSDGDLLGLRVVLDVDNGAGQYDVKFYTRADGDIGSDAGWTQLGTTKTGATGTTSIGATAGVDTRVGAVTDTGTSPLAGTVKRVEVRDGIAGTIVANPDFTGGTIGKDSADNVWTINGSGAGYVYADGSAAPVFSPADYAPLSGAAFTGDTSITSQNGLTITAESSAYHAKLTMDGGSDTSRGPLQIFQRGGVTAGYLGTNSAIVGGSSAGMTLYGVTSPLNLRLGANVLASFTTAGNTFTPTGAAGIPVIAKGYAAQTGDLFEAQDSAATVLASISSAGALTANGITVSAGYDINASHAAGVTTTRYGSASVRAAATGIHNTGVGRVALGNALSSGGYNTAVGSTAGAEISTGNYNCALGNSALALLATGSHNMAIGVNALGQATGSGSTGIGSLALYSLTSGTYNVGIGYTAGRYSTTQSNELFINSLDRTNRAGDIAGSIIYGVQSATASAQTLTLNASVTATYGLTASDLKISGGTASDNVALGSGSTSAGVYNTAVGYGTLSANAATFNVALGYSALANSSTGDYNVAIGSSAGRYSTTQDNELFVNSINRTDRAGDISESIIYGQQAAAPEDQVLTLNASVAIGGAASLGGGKGVTFLANADTIPTSDPTGGGVLYVSAGALVFRGSSGTITTIASA